MPLQRPIRRGVATLLLNIPIVSGVVLFCVAALPTAASAVAPDALATAAKVDWQWEIKIPLRDGVSLAATLYRPAGVKEQRPCLFTLTPYIRQSYHDRAMYFASHGYPFLTVDVRGRGNSGGNFRPLIQEGDDGYDVVEWLAKQPYCNGKVSMWGGSYAGYDQWATASRLPPHLSTIVPVAAPTIGVDFPARNNTFAPYDLQWLTFTSGRASQDHVFGDDAFWTGMYLRWIQSGTAFRAFDGFAGNPSSTFQEWLAHPEVDAYWDAYNPTAEQYARLTFPILTITGMYDDDQPGALAHYQRYMRAASPQARQRHYLVIGPWDHPGTRTPKQEFIGLKFGPASLVDLPQLHLDWYRYAMEGGPKPPFLHKAVTYYVSGDERWRYAESLEAVTAESRPYFLDSTGDSARELYRAGSLTPNRTAHGAPDQYRYDPSDLSLAKTEAESNLESVLERTTWLENPSKVVHLSAPFEHDEELSGFFRLVAWLSIDQPDTDFVVTVSEIGRDGTQTPLSTDVMRARYRESARAETLVRTTDPLRYEFKQFTFASRLVRKGCRLLLTLSAANSIFAQKNYNSGGAVSDETVGDSRPVTVRLYHDSKHATALYVPIAATDNIPQ